MRARASGRERCIGRVCVGASDATCDRESGRAHSGALIRARSFGRAHSGALCAVGAGMWARALPEIVSLGNITLETRSSGEVNFEVLCSMICIAKLW